MGFYEVGMAHVVGSSIGSDIMVVGDTAVVDPAVVPGAQVDIIDTTQQSANVSPSYSAAPSVPKVVVNDTPAPAAPAPAPAPAPRSVSPAPAPALVAPPLAVLPVTPPIAPSTWTSMTTPEKVGLFVVVGAFAATVVSGTLYFFSRR
jgi:hypothetical protein